MSHRRCSRRPEVDAAAGSQKSQAPKPRPGFFAQPWSLLDLSFVLFFRFIPQLLDDLTDRYLAVVIGDISLLDVEVNIGLFNARDCREGFAHTARTADPSGHSRNGQRGFDRISQAGQGAQHEE